jgi:ABC-type oligopeptide transport system substrate-binding subunit
MAGAFPERGIDYRDLPEIQARWPANYGFDPERAVHYFELALEELGETRASIEFVYNEVAATVRAMCEFLQSSLPQVFGPDRFEVTVRAAAGPALSAALLQWQANPHAYEVAFGSWMWGATLFRPNTQFQFYTPSGQLNVTDFMSPDLDEMYVRSLTEEYRLDQERLIALTLEMDALFMDRMLAIPITQAVGRTIVNERIILPVEWSPLLGYGTLYADIDLTR